MYNKKILIIEDDPVMQKLYLTILNKYFDNSNIGIDIACSIKKASEYLSNNVYDLYIVDLILKKGMNGTIMINTNYRPMIVVSAVDITHKLNSVDYIQKPINIQKFIDLVLKIII